MIEQLSGPLTAFLGIAALVIVTPGPDTAVTIRNTLAGGRAGGLATALGVSTGQSVWALATSAGIAALLVASEPLFLAVKYAGAAYLVLLGLQALREAWRPSAGVGGQAAEGGRAARLPARAAFRQGVVSDLGNPKMAAFFTSLLPQFAPAGPGGPARFEDLAALGLLFALMTLLWLAAYTLAVARVGDLLRRPPVRRLLEGATGAVLIGLGLRIATERP
ncbi:Threonine/homoserine/homoserine lactone efflux protein [Tistlia consotensis]|uniref:Threonine/homoserine/homoserine lactone efflux protein n=1 Tax=Tistlia consotensis USBA 355 TaxID=560819 RepID=A0A1Y6BJG3_9PROT|nr:LysE family translocator [Tistlia consotensis]SMF13489.1 Threonine/homoserine/homoserine lactone efflux protein [Tistlia consotensis USBA 355]SNR50451.1 Threonine/homoserine/homoserine lactone efflux protein [Tistlia consotensis]